MQLWYNERIRLTKEEHNLFLPGIKTELRQEAQVPFCKALPWAKKPKLLHLTVDVIILTVKRSGWRELNGFQVSWWQQWQGQLVTWCLTPFFPLKMRVNEKAKFKIKYDMYDQLSWISILPYVRTLVQILVSLMFVAVEKDINQRNHYMALFSHLTISYSIVDNRLINCRYCSSVWLNKKIIKITMSSLFIHTYFR